ncbi:MAG TPA: pyridoxal phosphate-dependent aminotransferase [Desulfitobacterium dehalogenans]|uniref:cysteine-S-conjugate beta-lyase n=1 Tax=Desulfitobacterium dehalogenans TaxID=36854 RepID=A0A7C6Z2K7_9FIRM|nr:pyridoxal phosphate-dependent aminotransferase [Desulfitobacterium dehalogenans]
MAYSFDEYIDRYGTESLKWDGFENRFPGLDAKGCIPMWVADTDFRVPQEVIDAIVTKAQFGIFGYPKAKGPSFDNAVINWIYKRHGWQLMPEWIVPTAGIVPAVTYAIQALTVEGEGVLIQPPVYYPFKQTIELNKRKTIENPLRLNEETAQYEIDFEDLEMKLKDPNTKIFILCNPHNPVGRVWSEEDLTKIGELCLEYGVIIFSDEIHSDLILKGNKHIPLGMLDPHINENVITAYSPSKTFNLAGLQASAIILPNKEIRKKYLRQLDLNQVNGLNAFAGIALEAAYNYGEGYRREFLAHVESNIDYALDYVDKHLNGVRIIKPQGTYLVWFDFRGTGMSADEIDAFIIEKAKVAVDLGRWFGEEGAGFLRFNFACHRSILAKALEQIKDAL